MACTAPQSGWLWAGWGPEQLQALPGLLYTKLRHIRQQRSTSTAAGEQHSLIHNFFAMVFILPSPSPFAPSPVTFICGTPSVPQSNELSGCILRGGHWEAPIYGANASATWVHVQRGRHPDHQISFCFFTPWQDYSSYYESIFSQGSWIYNTEEPVQLDTRWAQTSKSDSIDINT